MNSQRSFLPMVHRRYLIVSISLLVSLATGAHGQSYPFRHYTTSDGLAHPVVRKVFQDSRGFLWFGTGAGLMRYDGHEFRKFLPRDQGRIPIHEIFEADSSVLWVGTYGQGLAHVSIIDTTIHWLSQAGANFPDNYVTAMCRDEQRVIWVGTSEGICAFSPDGTLRRYRSEFVRDPGEIYGLARDRNGDLWIAAHAGLFRAQFDTAGRMTTTVILNRPTRSLLLLRNGEIVAGTSGGADDRLGFVCRIGRPSLDTLISYATTRTLIKAQGLCESEDGKIWIATAYGVFVVDGGRISHLRTENGLQNENVYDIMQDREGTMWFGSENGVMKLTMPRFLNYSMKEGLTSYSVISLAQDRKQQLWVGMWYGLNRLGPDGITHWDDTDGLLHHSILSIAEDPMGRMIVGTPSGVDVLEGGKVLKRRIEGVNAGARGQSMARRGNDLWIGTIGEILLVRNGAVVKRFGKQDNIPNDYIGSLHIDDDSTLWFGTPHHGIGRIREGKTTLVDSQFVPKRNDVHAIFRDAEEHLWICTETGAFVLQQQELTRPAFDDPVLHQGPVYFAMNDSSSHLWFGTDDGVYEWNGTNMRHYGFRDGLPSDIVRHGLVTGNGEIWFGTDAGVSRLERSGVDYASLPPHTYVDRLTAGDDEHVIAQGSSVEYTERSVTFRFNALSYIDEGTIRFQWMMEGFDREWQRPEEQRQVRYTNLSPGTYRFLVRAANRNGAWSSAEEFTFSIAPPYWRTWWFIGLSALALTGVLALVYRYRVRQLLRIERMRTRIAADLHDDIASSLASVALYSDVIQRQIQSNDAEVDSLLRRISDLSREVVENISTIVWAVDPRCDTVSDLFDYLHRHGGQLCSLAGISFMSQLPDERIQQDLSPEMRRSIFLIFKEGLNNILKHARCTTVRFTAAARGTKLSLRLEDDGRGFQSALVEMGNGINNMTSRARAIGGTLTVESNVGHGTRLTLDVEIA